ncbi:MAG: hypothetical protein M1836_006631 [Candelina mexicana]|nr:MAG: hypothetical protein M1836_006631 [Candelina mexicana]
MVPKAFPYPLGIGIDICHIPRVQNLIIRDGGKWMNRFTKRILNNYERRVLQHKLETSNISRDSRQLAQWLAGRFAAKEAAFKAVSTRRLSWHDITIRDDRTTQPTEDRCSLSTKSSSSSGSQIKPYALIHTPKKSASPSDVRTIGGTWAEGTGKSATREDADRPGGVYGGWESEGQIAELSISHDGDYATAVVLAVNSASEESMLVT